MTHPAATEELGSRSAVASSAAPLRNLYAARFVFALAWAALLAASSSGLTALSVTLLVVYPLFDLGAAAYDVRSSGDSSPRRALRVNMALSLLAAVGLAVAVASGVPDVLRVWGAWAVTAGAVQLVVAVRRYRLGGQWPMILSGGISALAGASFIVLASGDDPSLAGLAGYATVGGIFFAASAIRLHRSVARAER